MTTQTIQFESVSLSEVGSGTLTAFIYSGATLTATLASITENSTLKGRYTGTVTSIAAGSYRLVVKFNGITVSEPNDAVTLLLAVGTYVATRAAVLDSASVTAVQSGLALEATSQSIKGKTDNLPSDPADQSLIVAATDAVMTRLGAPAGASISADIAAISGGGGGDATLAKQEQILEAVESVADSVAAYAARLALEVQLRGFPNVICRNADYLEATESEIRITIEDLTGTAITEIAGTPVASLSWLFGMGTEAAPNLISGTSTWDGDSDELVIEIPKASTTGKQTGSLTWQIGVTIGTGENTKTRWLGGGTTRLIERQF